MPKSAFEAAEEERQRKRDAEEAEKRREKDKPDGFLSRSVEFLKRGLQPTHEAMIAKKAYDDEQRRKKEKYDKKK